MLATRRQYERDLALMYDVVDGVIRERRSQPARGEAPKDLLDLMLADGSLTDVQVRFQIMTFLIAGHETTSGLLSFTIYQLLRNPGEMAKAVAEVDRVFGGDRSRVPELADLAQLRYVKQCLDESLRLWPTAPVFGLTAKHPTTLGTDIAVKPGDVMLVLVPALHRDPAVWTDPELFDPDRFAPERVESIPANAWKPFGTGARACIGRVFAMQEATLVLASLLWHFELSDPYGYELRVKESLTLKPEGLAVRAKRRESTGAVAEVRAVAAAPVTHASHATPLLVLYGSNSGSSQDFAERIARDAARRGYTPALAPLDEHAGHLPREGAVVIVTGSYNGQPPDNARRFVDWLDGIEPGALTGVRYAVLGCGHRDWASTYQAVPRRIEARLAHAGARPLHARGEADAGGDFFGAFETWSRDALASLDRELGVAQAPAADLPVYQIERVAPAAHTIAAAYGAVAMTITENRELVHPSPGESRSKRHLEIELPPGVSYRAGDYLAVLPENEADLVRRAAVRFQLSPDDTIVVHRTRETSSVLPVDRPITVGQLLARFVELKAPATRSDLRTLAANTPCPPEAARLLALTADAAYETEVLAKRVSILELLERFTSTALPFARFLELLPPMKPRRYSIASSPLAREGHCALAVAVLDAPAWSGAGRYRGTCSNHLAQLAPGATFFGTIVSPNTPFFLPDDATTPVILIGAGTGIAPFRGFIEERAVLAARGTRLGTAELFFGCDHPEVDFLYRDELIAWEQLGAVSVRPAFFRDERDGVTFVQHRLWRDRARVAELIDAGAKLYLCGDGKRMAPAVRETLERIHAEHTGSSESAAREWLRELEAAGRFVADVFSG
jgi:cytochrome P450/NADPH-cytochrome P450 reductase